jgi:ferredoxin
MSHHAAKSGYAQMVERLNRFPQGAPPSDTLFAILKVLLTEKEAELVASLPIRPFDVKTAARAWRTSTAEAQRTLDGLASRALLVDMEHDEGQVFFLPPPMAGFIEFSMMRVRDDVDQKVLGELYYQYMNVEEDFIKSLFTRGETQLGRVFVNEPALPAVNSAAVLDYERATEVIKTARHIGVGVCYCRHKMQHVGKSCDAPRDICMTFGDTAASLAKYGYTRAIESAECLDLLDQAYAHNLVQFGENCREGVAFICNCCGCCCEAMIAARRFASLHPVHTTNYLPSVDSAACTGCGKCVNACPVEAVGLVSANDPHRPKSRKARVDESICLGCGVCQRVCGDSALTLKPRERRVITPVNSAHKTVVMAIERGNLQNLVFDNQAHLSHRAMAAVLGVVLGLPPLQQALASQQMKSRYLETIIKWMKV